MVNGLQKLNRIPAFSFLYPLGLLKEERSNFRSLSQKMHVPSSVAKFIGSDSFPASV